MIFNYEGKKLSSTDLLGKLIKKFGACPECGNDRVGGTPSVGSLHYDGEAGTFERSCICGWNKKMKFEKISELIHHKATLTRRRGSKLIGGVYEVSIPGKGRKLLPLIKLKELSGVKRIDQHTKIDAWLNTEEGTKWALEVPSASVYS